MAQYERLSIWEDDPHSLSWYDHVMGRKTSARLPSTPHMSFVDEVALERPVLIKDEQSEGFAYQEAWFSELMAQDKEKDCRRQSIIQSLTGSLTDSQVSQPKFLPKTPYFEYMFADAGLSDESDGVGQNSIDVLSFGSEGKINEGTCDISCMEADGAFLDEEQPITPAPRSKESHVLGLGEIHCCKPAPANTQYSIEDLTDYHLVVLDNSTEAYQLENHRADFLREQQATIDFFGIEDPPSYFELDEYLDCKSKKLSVTGGGASAGRPQSCDQRRMLSPKSQFLRFKGSRIPKFAHKFVEERTIPGVRSSNTKSTNVTRKRDVEELSSLDDPDPCDENGIRAKKARYSLNLRVVSEMSARLANPAIAHSISSMTTSSGRISWDFFNHRPLAVAPKGYAGQFDGMIIKPNLIPDFKFNIADCDVTKSRVHFTFGDRCHPNGIYTHTSIYFDPYCQVPDFTQENLPNGHPLITCMTFATDMTIAAAHANVVSLRNHDEEILRRESHIECAHARLEGVAVGYYRYYQGHLSVEEYHQAELCIC